MILCRFAPTCLCALILFAAVTGARAADHTTAVVQGPATHRVIALAEPGQTIHQPFADAAIRWLRDTAAREGFAVDYIRTTDPIDEAYIAAHDLFIQVNYPPYRWTPVAEAAFRKAMNREPSDGSGSITLLCSANSMASKRPLNSISSWAGIVFKSYIPDFATCSVHVEDAAHPVFNDLPAAFKIENDVL